MLKNGPTEAPGQHRISRIGVGALDHGESKSLAVHGSETGDFSSFGSMAGFADQGQCEGRKV